MTVTGASGSVVETLGGKPALRVLHELLVRYPEPDRSRARVGVVLDEYGGTLGVGDFLIFDVVGADPGSESLLIGGSVDVGRTVRFQLPDRRLAFEELQSVVSPIPPSQATLLFAGEDWAAEAWFEQAIEMVRHSTGAAAQGGLVTSGEVGMIGGAPHHQAGTLTVVSVEDQVRP
jgi:small ligand-binding sensory domain FIST